MGFDRTSPAGRPAPVDLLVVTMTEYEEGLPVAVAFPPETARSLAQAISEAGWRQFHVAETEKYAHVTYFFNGGVETPWPGEDRRLIPSPKVATYDLAPEMSAVGVTDALVDAIDSDGYDFIVANYANPDMVGHTGVWDATIEGAGRRRCSASARVVAAIERRTADPSEPGGTPAPVRSWPSPPTTATPTTCATPPATRHGPLPEPGARSSSIGRAGRGRRSPTGSSPTSRRPSSSSPACRAGPASPAARCCARRELRPPV